MVRRVCDLRFPSAVALRDAAAQPYRPFVNGVITCCRHAGSWQLRARALARARRGLRMRSAVAIQMSSANFVGHSCASTRTIGDDAKAKRAHGAGRGSLASSVTATRCASKGAAVARSAARTVRRLGVARHRLLGGPCTVSRCTSSGLQARRRLVTHVRSVTSGPLDHHHLMGHAFPSSLISRLSARSGRLLMRYYP